MKHILTVAAALAVAHTSVAAHFAEQVLSYAPGTGAGTYINSSVALGAINPIVGPGGDYPSVFSPFSPHYEKSQIVSIGAGGHLTLQLSHFVVIDRTPGVAELGVWESIFLTDTAYPDGTTGSPAVANGAGSAIVDVSADGVNWFTLNGNQPILFTLPGNYFTNSGPFDPQAPANPEYADFGKPFTASLSGFDGKTYPQILTLLDGSAGGTWLNLDDAPFEQVGFVRFRDVPQGPVGSFPNTLEIDAVAINTSLAASPVPEPGTGLLALLGAGVIGTFRRRQS